MAKDGTNRGGRRVRAGAKPDPLNVKVAAGRPATVIRFSFFILSSVISNLSFQSEPQLCFQRQDSQPRPRTSWYQEGRKGAHNQSPP